MHSARGSSSSDPFGACVGSGCGWNAGSGTNAVTGAALAHLSTPALSMPAVLARSSRCCHVRAPSTSPVHCCSRAPALESQMSFAGAGAGAGAGADAGARCGSWSSRCTRRISSRRASCIDAAIAAAICDSSKSAAAVAAAAAVAVDVAAAGASGAEAGFDGAVRAAAGAAVSPPVFSVTMKELGSEPGFNSKRCGLDPRKRLRPT
mmetsp:Transcript_16604/g.54223  ORF Transcript_16604/g.54223 Transcript_16604/m.54223 type:complete len:206 (-) Transcript_16604:911-1528(-)